MMITTKIGIIAYGAAIVKPMITDQKINFLLMPGLYVAGVLQSCVTTLS